MSRVFNFSAGPAGLPLEVLEQVRDELLDWHGAGMGVMEMSHRGKHFTSIIEAAEADLRELLAIPSNYRVLFLQGGATMQFSMVPINLLRGRASADYLVTGSWSKKALAEARRLTSVRVVADTEAERFTRAPAQAELDLDPGAAYLHYCSNETIYGVEFPYVPDCGDVPLVADMSSHILSRPVDVSRFGLIYAGAQKNIGPVGVTVVIVRDDLLGAPMPGMPLMLDYATYAANGSMYNTPPTFAIYVAGLVFQWLKRQGGLVGIERRNIEKAALLYDFIDASAFYANPVRREDRSRMNVPFTLARPELDARFVTEASAAGIEQIKGHKSVGGMRASIYNPMPVDGVRALVDFMKEFERRCG
ncbi:MAG: 3-phosphoserine/phosphohydroxythreonine transaminase [Rhodocyclaceae bacterium]|nr:3-phosphoserine/phosphohydroxythreonine transaminase [Rhodocyclaceae bacterium]